MRQVTFILLAGVAGLATAGLLVADAEAGTLLGRDASECEIARQLNIAKPGCDAPRTRGLAIGNIDQMPAAPPPTSRPAQAAAPPPAPPAPEPVRPAATAPPPRPAERVDRPATPRPTQAARPSQPVRQQYTAAFEINFEFGSTRLTRDARDILDRVGAVLSSAQAGDARFLIVGHTDSVGSARSNLRLSRARAASVVDYLTRVHGVSSRRLEAVGRGESEPLNRRNPAAAENRRVEIVNLGS